MSRRGACSSQDVRRAESTEALSASHAQRHAGRVSSPFSKLHISVIPAQLSVPCPNILSLRGILFMSVAVATVEHQCPLEAAFFHA